MNKNSHKSVSYGGLIKLYIQQMWNQQLEDRPGFDFIVKKLCKIFEDCKRDEHVLHEDFEFDRTIR